MLYAATYGTAGRIVNAGSRRVKGYVCTYLLEEVVRYLPAVRLVVVAADVLQSPGVVSLGRLPVQGNLSLGEKKRGVSVSITKY